MLKSNLCSFISSVSQPRFVLCSWETQESHHQSFVLQLHFHKCILLVWVAPQEWKNSSTYSSVHSGSLLLCWGPVSSVFPVHLLFFPLRATERLSLISFMEADSLQSSPFSLTLSLWLSSHVWVVPAMCRLSLVCSWLLSRASQAPHMLLKSQAPK